VEKMVSAMTVQAAASNVSVGRADTAWPLPPASVQRFLLDTLIPTVVLTDHKAGYTNRLELVPVPLYAVLTGSFNSIASFNWFLYIHNQL
jgi:hypothetical protein